MFLLTSCNHLSFYISDDPDRIVISNCPRDIEVNSEPGETVNVFWGEPFATNQAGTAFLDYQSHSPPTRLPPGKTVIMYSFKDDAGAVAICQFAVQVVEGRFEITLQLSIVFKFPHFLYS